MRWLTSEGRTPLVAAVASFRSDCRNEAGLREARAEKEEEDEAAEGEMTMESERVGEGDADEDAHVSFVMERVASRRKN